ncbi:hypothetical protein HHI36_019898 [Cryptolaemus montrouzieri]|uniref:Uncharacterized protein n=1 Tax=Cryptolaemus montrouzieri TaxID=559131 RepID=A0ABD2N9F2_9CUCU
MTLRIPMIQTQKITIANRVNVESDEYSESEGEEDHQDPDKFKGEYTIKLWRGMLTKLHIFFQEKTERCGRRRPQRLRNPAPIMHSPQKLLHHPTFTTILYILSDPVPNSLQ